MSTWIIGFHPMVGEVEFFGPFYEQEAAYAKALQLAENRLAKLNAMKPDSPLRVNQYKDKLFVAVEEGPPSDEVRESWIWQLYPMRRPPGLPREKPARGRA